MAAIEGSALTRRELFQHAGGVAALALAARLPLRQPAPPPPPGPPTLAGWSPLVGTGFDVWLSAGRRERVTLVEATGLAPRSLGRREVTGEAFSLLFGGGRDPVPAGTHLFRHPTLGWFTLFISPVGLGRNGRRYEAIVNHQTLAP